ncbi:hypothetical protein RIR_jg30607.t1 [Rhizophagus irregularis DAOM 181602=DAOM 197198]|nr:hypothetical protein RIR_jg37522.t1 [Rhizophagus irregularis DAOM 181602=DAOM 197198]GBC13353.2 hypothetical protein RIR_jg30607.t1 [Rhizophagus irregularis DAOM 181602=DAOM 197198]
MLYLSLKNKLGSIKNTKYRNQTEIYPICCDSVTSLVNDHIESICKGNVTTRDGRQTTCDHLFCFKAYRSRAFGGQLSYCCDENLSKNCCCELSINRRIYCLSCTTMRQA